MKFKNIGIFLAGMAFMGMINMGANVLQDVKLMTQSRLGHRYEAITNKLTVIDQLIGRYYLYEDEIETEELEEILYLGYVAGLGDVYSTYYSAAEYKDLMESFEGSYTGIGSYVSQNMNTGAITLINPFEGGPADLAGIKKDDILVSIDGEEVTGMDLNMAVSKMKGEAGTDVNVQIYRPSEEAYLDFTITRAVVEVPTVSYEMLENEVGYIQLMDFDVITVEQFKHAVEDLKNQGAKSMIFDLRDNGGGLLNSVSEILDILLPEGLLVYTEDKEGNRSELWADDPDCVDLPMVVLVNGNSASASELFTGALRDYEKAEIIGTTTYGKGIVQSFFQLSDGSAVKLTTSEYFTPKGLPIHGIGVEPDIIVEYDSEAESDTQLQAAVDYLTEQQAKNAE